MKAVLLEDVKRSWRHNVEVSDIMSAVFIRSWPLIHQRT